MESRAIKIKSPKNSKISIKVIPGHFATNHSHINYYIDMTSIKHRHAMAYEAAATMAMKYENNTMVDTIVCMDGCEVIAAFLARYLSKSGIMSMNDKSDICIITPEFNTNGQMIFRDNIQPMVWQKNILLLVASATTGKTINRSLECIKLWRQCDRNLRHFQRNHRNGRCACRYHLYSRRYSKLPNLCF